MPCEQTTGAARCAVTGIDDHVKWTNATTYPTFFNSKLSDLSVNIKFITVTCRSSPTPKRIHLASHLQFAYSTEKPIQFLTPGSAVTLESGCDPAVIWIELLELPPSTDSARYVIGSCRQGSQGKTSDRKEFWTESVGVW